MKAITARQIMPVGLLVISSFYAGAQDIPTSPAMTHVKKVFPTYDGKALAATMTVLDDKHGLRRYQQTSNAPQRDNKPQQRTITEQAGSPRVRSGDVLFDGLFALAVQEAKQDSVSYIRDGAYNHGKQIKCECFETGEKWPFVWTRDLSYSAYLGLAMIDPQRTVNSLLYKVSGYRHQVPKNEVVAGDHSGLQVIQDTGSGGSWPISTDRVSWAFGAEAVLNNLQGKARHRFAVKALEVLSNTLENDHKVAFDSSDGLYTGEESFLDWREQSYAGWIPEHLTAMATSKALSTNAAHYQALKLAARLAGETGKPALAQRYRKWASALKQAINNELWLEDAGLYSSLTAGQFDQQPMHKFDWLGQTLAIITGLADDHQRQQILRHYPHGPMGAPVIFPMQPNIAVYHNRAIWPFVTSYGLLAAIKGGNSAVANQAYDTLIRGAALNLSNMENYEWLSDQAWYQDPNNKDLSGPVISSRRQLWSVAGYLNMVIDGVFGLHPAQDGLHINPYITRHLRLNYFSHQEDITLQDYHWQGKKLAVTLHFTDQPDTIGVYQVTSMRLNGQPVSGKVLQASQLQDNNQLLVTLGKIVPQDKHITLVQGDPAGTDPLLFAPKAPQLQIKNQQGHIHLTIVDGVNQGDVEYRLFKNGQLLQSGLPAGQWQDPAPLKWQACYSAQAMWQGGGNVSHHSQVHCVVNGKVINVDSKNVHSNVKAVYQHGSAVLPQWGAPSDRFVVKNLHIVQAGRYALQVRYHNLAHEINTGITAGVKWLTLKDSKGHMVAQGAVVMPHSHAVKTYSTAVIAQLKPGRYSLHLQDYYNMSYLKNNATYGAAGGLSGPMNKVDLFGIRVMPMY